jgi:hypothetical protein
MHRTGLDAIAEHLGTLTPEQVDVLRGKLCIGIHRDLEVTDAAGEHRPLVSQAFCSALPVAYTRVPLFHWEAFGSLVLQATKEHGSSARTYKSGLIWAVPEGADSLREDARKALAWEDIDDEEPDLRLDDGQKRQLAESLKKAQRDIKETVWHTYKNVLLLGKTGEWKSIDLGLIHSSAACVYREPDPY